jgi:hypothetical protein
MEVPDVLAMSASRAESFLNVAGLGGYTGTADRK